MWRRATTPFVVASRHPFWVNRSPYLDPRNQNDAQICAAHVAAETINSRGEICPPSEGTTLALARSPYNEMLSASQQRWTSTLPFPSASWRASSAPMLPVRRAPLVPYIHQPHHPAHNHMPRGRGSIPLLKFKTTNFMPEIMAMQSYFQRSF